MDMKASARAKHASSQRGKARHSTHSKKKPVGVDPLPSSSSSSSAHTQSADVSHHSEGKYSSLPSNWSRYEEEEEIDPRFHDSIAVKSKGANYSDLLAEKSIYQSPEMANARKRLMQSRGLDILNSGPIADNIWSRDEIFDGEDSFFSLDLKLLDEELAKVNIAERLCIDPKFIPVEERDVETDQHDSINEDDSIDQAKTKENRVLKSTGYTNIDENVAEELATSSNVPTTASPYLEEHVQDGGAGLSFYKEILEPFERDESMVSWKPLTPYQEMNLEVEAKNDEVFEQNPELKSKRDEGFKPEAAEAELDALLDMLDSHSFKETSTSIQHKPIESIVYKPTESLTYKTTETVAYNVAEPDVWQDETPLTMVNVDAADGILEQSMESFRAEPSSLANNMFLTTKSTRKADNTVISKEHVQVQMSSFDDSVLSSVNPPLNLDDDFDSWLDSL